MPFSPKSIPEENGPLRLNSALIRYDVPTEGYRTQDTPYYVNLDLGLVNNHVELRTQDFGPFLSPK
jgi:hypothetical protein